jgi:ligand-binding sensor domain-containing protein
MFFRRTIKKELKKLLSVVWLLSPVIGLSQNNIPTGSWRTHYSFNSTITLTQSSQNVYAASRSGLYIIDKNDKSITSITKLNGLSETGITQVDYNSTTSTLLITYDNGQIDLLQKNSISSIPDIKLSEILSSKITHHMKEQGKYMYLSTDFGLLQIDTESKSINESFLNLSSTGDNLIVYASTFYNDSLFLATEKGVMVGSLNDNLKDFTKWKRFDDIDGINVEVNKVIALYNNRPITGNSSQGILTYNDGKWVALGELIATDITSIETNINTAITASGNLYELNNNGLRQIESSLIVSANHAVFDGSNYWVADGRNGTVQISGNLSESIYPNGPFFNDIVTLKTVQNKVFAMPNFKNFNGTPVRNNSGFSVFENGSWANYNSTGYSNTKAIPEFLDISSVSSLSSGELVFSSYGYGLLTWGGEGVFEIIDESNSPLINSSAAERNVLIADIETDNKNLWVLNNKSNTSLHSYNNDKSWSTYNPSSQVSNATKIISTPWGDQWITINATSGGGIIVHNLSNEETILKASGVGTIPSNIINQIALDKEDKIWIATQKGVVYYLYPYSIISDPNQDAIVPIIDSRLLFSNEKVNTLAVDGGNRIWMGTNKGAWLFDNDGSVLVDHFNTENSPILSDVVTNITINHKSGEVFFNTDKGLISYRGTATISTTFDKPKIFPNPVTPEYTGVITIEGIPENGKLKITDSSGRLVANIEANGNTAVWDLKNEFLSQIGSGVYFVFISSDDGSSTQIGKIAVVK